jgi:sugar phosphate isomerase/epimerase
MSIFRTTPWVFVLALQALCAAGAFSAEPQSGWKERFFIFDNGTGRGSLPLEAQAKLMKECGYAGVGYTGCDKIPEMLKALDENGLKMFSIYVALKVGPDGTSLEPQLKEAIEQLSGRDTLIWLTVQGGTPSTDNFDDKVVAAVRELADLADKSHLRIAFYPHLGFYVAQTEDALRLAGKIDRANVGVSLNLCHFLKLNDEKNLEALLTQAMPRLFAVSINGADRGDTRAMGWDRLIQTLDRGDFDNVGLIKLLKRLDYRGPIGLQCYAIPGDTRENMKRSADAWARIVTAVDAEASSNGGTILEVPASKSVLCATVNLPDGLAPATQWKFVNAADPNDCVTAQEVRGAAPESNTILGGKCLAVAIPPGANDTARKFRLEPAGETKQDPAAFRVDEKEGVALKVLEGDRPVLNFNFGEITCDTVPADDVRRTRACYVHPVWGLDGEVLTDDFPKDHYHHHGIFWSWPHVQRDGKEYDLWTGQGIRHRFVRWLSRETGPVAAVLAAENGWYIGDQQAMIERVCLRIFKSDSVGQVVDLNFEWIPVERPITLWGAEGKSYGGLSIRYAPRKDTAITVPAGLTKDDLLETRLPWADLSAKYADRTEPSGAAILISPNHPDFPPTWLTRHYGCLCVGWPGIVSKTFEPGQSIRTAYRVWIHRGQPDTAALTTTYEAYQAATGVRWNE